MEAIILAGGFGTRLRSVVSDVPKPMAPIAGRPFLELLLDHLTPYGFNHIVLSTGYMHEKIEAHFGNSYHGVDISYAIEDTPLGTGGGMRNAIRYCNDDDVVVVNGDTLFKIDYDDLARFFHSRPTRLAVVLRQVPDTSRYGSVTTDCCDRISRFTEKAAAHGTGTINGGIYMLHRSLLEEQPLGQPFSFEKDILQSRYTDEAFFAYTSGAYFIDIGIPEDYQKLINDY
ncbi:MAG: nucleotidyltransferase family protein [Bacteroidaceae bacterium]|nr:nucleotidyltransferase family protein [Bacteroidales bacterium]MBR0272591.1 nucleotidyltransferase family protein [Bacteroidaceae bacterium]